MVSSIHQTFSFQVNCPFITVNHPLPFYRPESRFDDRIHPLPNHIIQYCTVYSLSSVGMLFEEPRICMYGVLLMHGYCKFSFVFHCQGLDYWSIEPLSFQSCKEVCLPLSWIRMKGCCVICPSLQPRKRYTVWRRHVISTKCAASPDWIFRRGTCISQNDQFLDWASSDGLWLF